MELLLSPRGKKGRKNPNIKFVDLTTKAGNTGKRANEMMPEETMRMWDILQDKWCFPQ